MPTNDQVSRWLHDRYWEAHKEVESLENTRREIEERLKVARGRLEQVRYLHDRWDHEVEQKRKSKE